MASIAIDRLPLQQVRDACCPAGSVGGAEAAAGFGVEAFVGEEQVAAPWTNRAQSRPERVLDGIVTA